MHIALLLTTYMYLLIALSVFQGMLRSAFIARDDSVGICTHTCPWMSSNTLVRTSGVEDDISCDNWACAELSLALSFLRASLRTSVRRRKDLLDAFADSTLG